jgi:hypothetical protein
MGVAEGLGPAVLDLPKGITDPESANAPTRCERWPDDLRLKSTDGDSIRGLCKATNLCDYCARIIVVENAEVLAQDAMSNSAPSVYVVTTTGNDDPDPAAYQRDREQLADAIRRRCPDAEWATQVEFTTGRSTYSRGRRFPHWNDLVKNVTAADIPALQEATLVWCERQGADPRAQYVGEVTNAGGLMRYVALHFAKTQQAPPKGWRGHRFRTTRGYLGRPMKDARAEAREVLRARRHLNAALREGLAGDEAEWRAAATLAEAAAKDWHLVREQPVPSAWGADGWPSAWTTVDMPIGAAA